MVNCQMNCVNCGSTDDVQWVDFEPDDQDYDSEYYCDLCRENIEFEKENAESEVL